MNCCSFVQQPRWGEVHREHISAFGPLFIKQLLVDVCGVALSALGLFDEVPDLFNRETRRAKYRGIVLAHGLAVWVDNLCFCLGREA